MVFVVVGFISLVLRLLLFFFIHIRNNNIFHIDIISLTIMGEILCFLLNFPAKTLYHMGLQFSSGGCRSISFLLKICNIYFLFCLKETCCVSWFLIKKITLVLIIMWFWKTLSAWQLIFFIFFYKTQKFHSHIALKQNNHSNSTVLTKGAALPFFCLWSLGDIWWGE